MVELHDEAAERAVAAGQAEPLEGLGGAAGDGLGDGDAELAAVEGAEGEDRAAERLDEGHAGGVGDVEAVADAGIERVGQLLRHDDDGERVGGRF